jgi:heme exporter protein D
MHWNNATEFFAMGGYALYVWGSFGACALGMLAEPLLIRHRHREVLRTLRERLVADAEPDPPTPARPHRAPPQAPHPEAR